MIQIELLRRELQFTKQEQSLAKGAPARDVLRREFQRILDSKPNYANAGTLWVSESTVGRMIGKYSEQQIFRPLLEIRYWFAYESGAFIEEGYPPLYYLRSKNNRLLPNKSAVAAVGEGVAGLIAQRQYGCRKLARPIQDYPDAVMESRNSTYLVEAKATQTELGIKGVLSEELPRFVNYVSACKELDTRDVVGLLIGTQLVTETQYVCFIVEVTVL